MKSHILTNALRLAAMAVTLTLLSSCFPHMRHDQDRHPDGPDEPAPREMERRR